MSRGKQLSAVLTAAVLTVGLSAGPAQAAVPSNDTQAGATPIAALPFSTTIDTSEATTDAADTALNDQCGAPVTNGSVWFSYTAPTGVTGLLVDVSASTFSAGVIIAENGSVIACGPGATGTRVTEGSTYSILAFSDTPGVTGGSLRLRAEQASVPEVSLTVDPRGKVDRFGNAILSGSYTCTGGDFLDLFTSLKQPVGRFAVQGDGFLSAACDGVPHRWSVVVTPYNGKFAGGKSASFTFAFSCGTVFCAEAYTEQTVRLSR